MSQIRHVYVKFYHIPNLNYTSINVIMCNCSWKELFINFINCQSINNQEIAGRKACRGQMGLRPSLLLSTSSDSSLQPPTLHLVPCKAALLHQIHMLATYIQCFPYKAAAPAGPPASLLLLSFWFFSFFPSTANSTAWSCKFPHSMCMNVGAFLCVTGTMQPVPF